MISKHFILQNNNKKICLVASSLGKGGAERCVAVLSRMLNKLGYNVHIVIFLNIIDYEYTGKLLNLGALKDENDTFFSKFKRLKIFSNYLNEHNFDYIIDNRSRNFIIREYIISKLIYRSFKVIYAVHSYNLDYYFPKSKWLTKFLYKNANSFACVSRTIEDKMKSLYGFKNVRTVYNAIEHENIESVDDFNPDYSFILVYGRLDEEVKNHTLLFNSYKDSKLPENDIKLVVLGSGKDLGLLKQKVIDLRLENNVVFISFKKNPLKIVEMAKFVCLSSRFEGFPRALLESLSVGTPVISVDCKSGPNEIIQNRINGLLVPNYNIKALASAMNSFIFDKELYQKCKDNSKKSVAKFSKENIAQDWKNLLESINEN